MATFGNTKTGSVKVNVASGTPAADLHHFVQWDATNGNRRVENADATNVDQSDRNVAGILAEAVDTTVDGLKESSMYLPDSGYAKVELGEAVTTVGDALRPASGAETPVGTAFLADASGDPMVATAMETGAVGDVITVQFTGPRGEF